MDILKDKIVKIKQSRRCFACARKFEVGTRMKMQVNTYTGIPGSVYTCLTCNDLLRKHKQAFFDYEDSVYPSECVKEMYSSYSVNNPEDLMIAMDEEEKQKAR